MKIRSLLVLAAFAIGFSSFISTANAYSVVGKHRGGGSNTVEMITIMCEDSQGRKRGGGNICLLKPGKNHSGWHEGGWRSGSCSYDNPYGIFSTFDAGARDLCSRQGYK